MGRGGGRCFFMGRCFRSLRFNRRLNRARRSACIFGGPYAGFASMRCTNGVRQFFVAAYLVTISGHLSRCKRTRQRAAPIAGVMQNLCLGPAFEYRPGGPVAIDARGHRNIEQNDIRLQSQCHFDPLLSTRGLPDQLESVAEKLLDDDFECPPRRRVIVDVQNFDGCGWVRHAKNSALRAALPCTWQGSSAAPGYSPTDPRSDRGTPPGRSKPRLDDDRIHALSSFRSIVSSRKCRPSGSCGKATRATPTLGITKIVYPQPGRADGLGVSDAVFPDSEDRLSLR